MLTQNNIVSFTGSDKVFYGVQLLFTWLKNYLDFWYNNQRLISNTPPPRIKMSGFSYFFLQYF